LYTKRFCTVPSQPNQLFNNIFLQKEFFCGDYISTKYSVLFVAPQKVVWY
jgi:hypothetical protein